MTKFGLEVLTGKALSFLLEFIDKTVKKFFVYKCKLCKLLSSHKLGDWDRDMAAWRVLSTPLRMVKLEERTTKLKALEKTAREDIDNLKANHVIIKKKQDNTKDALDKKIKGLDGKIAEKKIKLKSCITLFGWLVHK